MIMFTITKPKGKLKKLLAAGALVLLLGVFVPGVYMALSDVGAMSLFAAGDAIADEPPTVEMNAPTAQDEEDKQVKQDTETTENPEIKAEEAENLSLWGRLKAVIFGEEPQVVPY